MLAAWRWDVRGTIYVTVALGAIAASAAFAAPPSLHFGLNGSEGSANNATNGRTKLVSGGLGLVAERPLEGYGSGSFEREYKLHRKATLANATSASHTIPVTVAAEQGIVGFALYIALLAVAFVTLFSAAGRSPPQIAIAACFAALVLHTWVYADFLEDPVTWTLLGIGVALGVRMWESRSTEGPPRRRSPRGGDALRRKARVAWCFPLGRTEACPASPPAERPLGSPVRDYLKRLVTTGAAYQAAEIFAKGFAVITLPLYTRHVSTAAHTAPTTRCSRR